MDCNHPPACPPSCSHCLAYDRLTRSLCASLASPDSKWCSVHEELQAKLLKTYKRYTLAVDNFDNSTLPSGSIEAMLDLPLLRRYSEATRDKWSLIHRVVVARSEHHDQFYAGGDEGHCSFVDTLKAESNRLESLLRVLDKRAYAITLANSKAEWILVPQEISFICDDEPITSFTEMPPTPPPTPPFQNQSLPLTKSQRKKASRKSKKGDTESSLLDGVCRKELPCRMNSTELLKRLRLYLLPPPNLEKTINPITWYNFISTLFRHVILRIPSLAPLALDPSPLSSLNKVEDFLDLLEERSALCCGEEIQKLSDGMKFAAQNEDGDVKGPKKNQKGLLGVGVLRDGIAECFRTPDESGEHVSILGGKIYKEASKVDLNDEGWTLFYQFIGCAGCALSVTRSYYSLARNRRLALLGKYPAWNISAEKGAEHIMRVAGIVVCGSNTTGCGKKIKRVEQKGKSGKGGRKNVLVEEWERAWMYIKMPLGEESILALEAFAAIPARFEILARDASTSKILYAPPSSKDCQTPGCKCSSSSDLWLSRVRSGTTPAERKEARFSTNTFFATKTVLDAFRKTSSPESRYDLSYTDCIEVLIMDTRLYEERSSDWVSFADGVAATVSRSRGSSTLQEEREKAVLRGELSCIRSVGDEAEERFVARKMFRERS